MNKSTLRIISFILSFILISYLFSFIDLNEFWKQLKKINLFYYFIALVIYMIGYGVRAYRVKILFNQQSFTTFYLFMATFQLFLRTIPFKLGELFFPVLLNRLIGSNYGEGIAKMVFVRLMDLISLFFVMFISIIFLKDFHSTVILIILFLIIIATILFLVYLKKIVFFLQKHPIRLFSKFNNKINFHLSNIDLALSIPNELYFQVFFLSIIDKLVNTLVAYIILLGLDLKFPLIEFTIAYFMAGLTAILPITVLGSFGVSELGWAGTLVYLGTEKDLAISSGFSFNIIAFTYTIIIGIVCYFILLIFYKINIFISKRSEAEIKLSTKRRLRNFRKKQSIEN